MASDERKEPLSLDNAALGIPALVLLALVAWLPTVFLSGFAFDDREALFGNPVVEGDLPLSAVFDRDYWHHRGDAGHYRPTATLSLRLDHALWGERAFGYHATNALLHAMVVLLAALTFARRSGSSRPFWFGLAVFAVHPVLADSIAWLSGRTSMVSALGALIGALLLVRVRSSPAILASSALGILLALLGKEDGVVFAAAYLLLVSRERRVQVILGVTLGLGVYLALRWNALGAALPSAPHAPLANAPLLERMQIAGFMLCEALRIAILPFRYPPQYRPDDLAPVDGAFLGAVIASGAWLFWLSCAIRPVLPRYRDPASLSAALAALSLFPVMQIVPSGEVFAPRFLYLPLLFAAPLLSAAAQRVTENERSERVLCSAALMLFIALAWHRSTVYESRASFRESILEHHPDDVHSWNGLGHAYFEEGRIEEAREAWRRAIEIDEEYSRPWTNLGVSHLEAGELDYALPYLEQAVTCGPENPVAHVWYGRALLASGEAEEAIAVFTRATRLASGLGPAWIGLARAHLERGDADGVRAARNALDRARALAPKSADVRELSALMESLEARD